ncbi:hypothetical protein EGW08_020726 [Elysia chlorotica]|uniref:DDE Tnp4 domain-containing protein n=1 Tax=Elysia chlorotica TaxID=188477 RepID=A0A3S1BP58_ELYCH|nr:hypothetical protein EGW08_020726 [Elysia chlorotica]
MEKANVKSNEIGRRLVKGPRQSARNQAATGDKYATGYQKIQTSTNPARKKEGRHPNKQAMLNILQLNICGLKNKKIELAKVMTSNNIHIAVLQESLHKTTNVHLTGYTAYPCTCENCRGIITYIRNDLIADCEHQTQTDDTDIQKATIWYGEQKYTIYNIYSPPTSICQIDSLHETMYNRTIIAGDFNGHSPQWGYTDTNGTGKYLEELHGTVVDYPANMAGVDLSDQLIAYNPMHRRTIKWWKKLAFHMLSLTLVQAHILHNKFLLASEKRPWQLCDFAKNICLSLVMQGGQLNAVPEEGKPAYRYLRNHPDWVPTLKLGHQSQKNADPTRYTRLQGRKRKRDEDDSREPTVNEEVQQEPPINLTLVEDLQNKDKETSTELTTSYINAMETEVNRLSTELIKTKAKLKETYYDSHYFEGKDERVKSFTDNLEPGDVVLADRGFDISESVALRHAEVKIPAFTKGRKQLPASDILATRKLARLRIHVERVIGAAWNKFSILQSSVPIRFLQSRQDEDCVTLDKIVTICYNGGVSIRGVISVDGVRCVCE